MTRLARIFLSLPVHVFFLFDSAPSLSSSLVGADTRNVVSYNAYAPKYDDLDGNDFVTDFLGISDMRKHAASFVRGDTLEVAVGTGIQSEYYDWTKISAYTAIDSSKNPC